MNKVQTGNNQFCGPAALSVISGHSVDYCAKVIGDIIGKAPDKVKGVFPADLFKAAKKLRIDYKEIEMSGSLYFVATCLAHKGTATYLVTLPRHYIVIEVTLDRQLFICDNHTKEPLNLANSARLSQRIEKIWKVSAKPPAVLVNTKVEVRSVDYNGESAYYINVIKEFIDPEDNISINKGLFRASRSEFSKIVEKLKEIENEHTTTSTNCDNH